jgi:hypothetical protein
MKFSILNLMLLTFGIALLAGCTFSFPKIGYLILSIFSVFVIPPFIWVGIVNTRGARQSFFIGAAITGTPHFIYSVYTGIFLATNAISTTRVFGPSGVTETTTGLMDSIDSSMVYFHSIPILLGCMGGGMGMFAYWVLVTSGPKAENRN